MTTLATAGRATRIDGLRQAIMARKGSFPAADNALVRAVAQWRAAAGRSGPPRSRVQVRAAYLHELVQIAAVEIEPEWMLAGVHLPTAYLGVELPEADSPEHARRLAELGVGPEHLEAVRQAARPGGAPSRWATGQAPDEMSLGRGGWGGHDTHTVYWASGWIENHSVRDYAKVLRLGFGGIRGEVEAQLAAADLADPEYPQKESFWRAALEICDAGILLGARYAGKARELAAAAAGPEERLRLEAVAEACQQVPAHGARSLREAVQS
ncbi:MAG: pyruvate formate lyase family protein, partial [Gemmatimonadota bacterium]